MIRLPSRSRPRGPGPLDLELEVDGGGTVHLEHFCPGADQHRLLGVALDERERALLAAGESVAIPVRCDRCLWERRLVLRLRG